MFVPYKGPTVQENKYVKRAVWLIGMSLNKVVQQEGRPSNERLIRASEIKDELRLPLLNYYPQQYEVNKKVAFRELSWKSKEKMLMVWAHEREGQWIVLDACEWRPGVAF